MVVSVVNRVGLGGSGLVCFYVFFSYVSILLTNSRYFSTALVFEIHLLLGYILLIVLKSNMENFSSKDRKALAFTYLYSPCLSNSNFECSVLNGIHWKTLFIEALLWGAPCEYPVTKASTLNLKSLWPAPDTGTEMEVNRRSFLEFFAAVCSASH